MVEGIDCGSEESCPEGSTYQSSNEFVIALVVIIALLWLLFAIKHFIAEKVMQRQRMAVAKEKELSERGDEQTRSTYENDAKGQCRACDRTHLLLALSELFAYH